jgi:hypothetical protein
MYLEYFISLMNLSQPICSARTKDNFSKLLVELIIDILIDDKQQTAKKLVKRG